MITIRPAVKLDLDHILRWRREAAEWLASRGSDQWSDAGLSDQAFTTRVHESISAGETWMADLDGQPVGTIAIDQWTDSGLWHQSEIDDGVFVHRMIIDRTVAGHGVGRALLDHADHIAAELGRKWVRLDAWTTNTGLHEYYRRAGFRHVRTVSDHHSPSAALFERPVSNDTPRPTSTGEEERRKTP